MPAIPLQLLDCAIYLYPTAGHAERGEAAGGSGFLAVVPAEGFPRSAEFSVGTVYAVTCDHVIRPLRGPGAPVIRLNNRDGGFEIRELDTEAWIPHSAGDDLTVAPIGLSMGHHRFASVPISLFAKPTEEDLVRFTPGIDTLMIGRFVTHEGKQQNTPAVRFGNVAMLPLEPIVSPRGIRQESFLIEMRSLPGYSGSPVFSYVEVPHEGQAPVLADPPQPAGIRIKFIGIDWCHLPQEVPVLQADGTRTTDFVKLNSGMAGVVPSWKLAELLLEDPEVIEMREESEEAFRAKHPKPEVELDAAREAGEEYQRFEDLAQRLVSVPKKELDKKRREKS
jgi:hypothetical protein